MDESDSDEFVDNSELTIGDMNTIPENDKLGDILKNVNWFLNEMKFSKNLFNEEDIKNANYIKNVMKEYESTKLDYNDNNSKLIYVDSEREFRFYYKKSNSGTSPWYRIEKDISSGVYNFIKSTIFDFSDEELEIFIKFAKVHEYLNDKDVLYNDDLYNDILYIGKLTCEYMNDENKFSESEKKVAKIYMYNCAYLKTYITLKNTYISSLQYSLHNNYKSGFANYIIAKEEFETLAKKQKEEKQAEQEKQNKFPDKQNIN
jgi:hypothetical protein